ncbi:MAG TPA: 50S ribosomal protein L31 [Firmicutes bacterium]|nr:50S ribosomal protein L31 [Bacillota bacterium]
MKPGIHPNYGKSVVTCSCGETFETRSTRSEIRVEVCSKCHPFYTGRRQTLSSTGGRVERFLTRYNLKEKEEKSE